MAVERCGEAAVERGAKVGGAREHAGMDDARVAHREPAAATTTAEFLERVR